MAAELLGSNAVRGLGRLMPRQRACECVWHPAAKFTVVPRNVLSSCCQGKSDDKKISDQCSLYVSGRQDARNLAAKLWRWYATEFDDVTEEKLVRVALRASLLPATTKGLAVTPLVSAVGVVCPCVAACVCVLLAGRGEGREVQAETRSVGDRHVAPPAPCGCRPEAGQARANGLAGGLPARGSGGHDLGDHQEELAADRWRCWRYGRCGCPCRTRQVTAAPPVGLCGSSCVWGSLAAPLDSRPLSGVSPVR